MLMWSLLNNDSDVVVRGYATASVARDIPHISGFFIALMIAVEVTDSHVLALGYHRHQ